ncbi:biotin carboxylase N-terminal domain-containing protein [Sphingomonas sp. DT-204]|uniref:ATP-binding protein n=1 Tax=Sphingomonas sp. DT-204 TaxID=3396166 RepID=UPI003F1CA875
MFKKILIANRGEIACRVMRTARRMGIATVAVYSDADARAPHVRMADEVVRLGPAPANESYLKAELILDAAKITGADAIHPGYGFLSERESFARACAEARIAFIGPPPEAIAAMGDKIESKKLALAAGVNVVPGFVGEIRDTGHAVEIANDIGYPVMMKASAGGGGKGMRLAFSEKDVREEFESVRREGLASFGDDRVFIEKFIEQPRHIEIQVLGDRHGTILYLGERECSIQRRHQKVVEEAPSPFVTPAMRERMGEQAVALARAVGYYSAGTVELIVSGADTSGEGFYFLEMNTRLQVEHPVTEMVTGLDLVEQMIRVAAGEKLAFAQDDVTLTGWAIENRVYAEDPYRGFLPSTGRLVTYRPPPTRAPAKAGAREAGDAARDSGLLPSQEHGVEGANPAGCTRVDDGVAEGGEVSMFYDPMIAKLITWAPTREEAADRQIAALDQFRIEGIGHNIDFLSAIMQHPRFRDGRLTTGFIAEEYPEGFHGAPASDELLGRLAAVAVLADLDRAAQASRISGQLDGPALPGPERVVLIAGRRFDITVDGYDRGFLVNLDPNEPPLDVVHRWRPGDPLFSCTIDDVPFHVGVARDGAAWRLTAHGASHKVRVYRPHVAALAAHMIEKVPPDTSKLLLAPMPGLLTRLDVAAGDKVEAGQPLAVVEAMKMENILRAEKTGTVKAVNFVPGDSLVVDAAILEFE